MTQSVPTLVSGVGLLSIHLCNQVFLGPSRTMDSTQFHAIFFIIKLHKGLVEINKNTMKVELCPNCGSVMDLNKVIDERTAIMKCEHCGKQEKYVYDEKTFPNDINTFSWGAFVLWPYWGFGNKMSYLFLVSIAIGLGANFFPIIFSILSIALSIFYGLKGKRLSWNNKAWESPERFEEVQKRWDIVGKIVFGIVIVLILIIIFSLI